MSQPELTIRITGAYERPEDLELRDLQVFLEYLTGAADSYARFHELESSGPVSLSLIGVTDGSAKLVIAPAPEMVPVLTGIAQAIGQDNIASLPRATQEHVERLQTWSTRHAAGVELIGNEQLPLVNASLDPAKPLTMVVPKRAKGSTTLYGTLVRVGGNKPRARILVQPDDTPVIVSLTRGTARQLAKRLYEVVALEGEACWDSETWEIVSFKVDRVLPYRARGVQEAFQSLAEVAGDAWDEVDASEFVARVRGRGD